MRTSNPTLNPEVFSGLRHVSDRSEAMTVSGVINKTAILLFLVLLSAGWTWNVFVQSGMNPASVSGYMMGGVIGGLIAALVTVFKKEWAPYTAPVYALLEGLFIGGVSSLFEANYPGIVIQATMMTFGTLAVMLAVYKSGLIEVNDKFRIGVVAATGAIALVYFISFIASFFGASMSFIYGSGLFGIGFSMVVVGIAALNLLLDFDLIEQGASHGLPKYMDWYAAFSLMVTLIWLYVEILRLLSKLRER